MCSEHAALKCFKVSFPREYAHEHMQELGTRSEVMTSAGTPLRRSARPGWYGSGCPRRARARPSVLASCTAPSASASHSRGLACEENWAGSGRLTRTLAPGITSLARLSTSFRISAQSQIVTLMAGGKWLMMPGHPGFPAIIRRTPGKDTASASSSRHRALTQPARSSALRRLDCATIGPCALGGSAPASQLIGVVTQLSPSRLIRTRHGAPKLRIT